MEFIKQFDMNKQQIEIKVFFQFISFSGLSPSSHIHPVLTTAMPHKTELWAVIKNGSMQNAIQRNIVSFIRWNKQRGTVQNEGKTRNT